MRSARLLTLIAVAWAFAWAPCPLVAEDPPAEPPGVQVTLDFEVKAHLRDASTQRLPSTFWPLPPELLPPGEETAFLETVHAGTHLELSVLSIHASAIWSENLAARARIDVLDLYNRNPTTTGRQVHLAEAWLQIGRESLRAVLPEEPDHYLKVGKFGRFDRQEDRHLESYGLIGTAVNRFADVGLEAGIDLTPSFYLKAALTQGNPVFLRDPNALAGDQGSAESLPLLGTEIKSGFPMLYNAPVQDLDFGGDLQVAGAVGFRTSNAAGRDGGEIMVWGNRRKLADRVEIDGSPFGGDLALFRGPGGTFPLDFTNDRKEELGVNLWIYLGSWSLFGQYVDQDLGGMSRDGYELETAWAFRLPLRWAVAGQQLFPFVTPAIRYSRLEPDIGGDPDFAWPSVRWKWEKIDVGVRLGILDGMDLTAEYAFNRMWTANRWWNNDELLVTMRWRP